MDAWQLVFQTSLPLMAAAYLLYPYGGVFAIVAPGLHTLGYQYFFVTFWSILGSKQLRRDAPAVCSVALGLFVTNAGQALGLGLWNVLCAGITAAGLHIVSSVATFVLVVVAVTFEHPAFGWSTVRPGESPGPNEGSDALAYEAVVERIRSDYGLSPRERDVACCWAAAATGSSWPTSSVSRWRPPRPTRPTSTASSACTRSRSFSTSLR